MPLSPDDLQDIGARTLAHYEQHAQSYWEGTRDHDVSQNIDALLRHIEGTPPFTILDLGCGPGRDLAAQAVATALFVEDSQLHEGLREGWPSWPKRRCGSSESRPGCGGVRCDS
mgnify:CR=1 FL=1